VGPASSRPGDGRLEAGPTGSEGATMNSIEVIRQRRLPHWDVDGAPYFVTSCLEGSIPARGLLDISQYRTDLERRPRPPWKTEPEWAMERWKLAFARTEQWLDMEPGARHLAEPTLAQSVVDSMYFFAGQRYDLLAFVVMPSHIHWVFWPLESWVLGLGDDVAKRTPRERLVHSLNSFTAGKCNGLLEQTGAFWQHESYDHWVRDAEELERIIHYVEGNPVKAGLVRELAEWPFSSAHDRRELGLELGQPLVRVGPTSSRPETPRPAGSRPHEG
jgi:type I restriction enzyme R subunit